MIRIKTTRDKSKQILNAKAIAEELYHSTKLKTYFEEKQIYLHKKLLNLFSRENLSSFDVLYNSPQGEQIPLVVFDEIDDCNQSLDMKKLKEIVDNDVYLSIITDIKQTIKDKAPRGTLRKVVTNTMQKKNIVVKEVN